MFWGVSKDGKDDPKVSMQLESMIHMFMMRDYVFLLQVCCMAVLGHDLWHIDRNSVCGFLRPNGNTVECSTCHSGYQCGV